MVVESPTLGLWRVVTRELRASSRETKRGVVGSLASVTIVVLVAIADAVTGSPGQEPFRLAAIIVAALALHLRAVAGAWWQVGTEATARRRGSSDERALHDAMHAVPAVNAVSAVMFGVAAGLCLPSLLKSWVFFVFGLGLVGVALWTAQDVIRGA